MVPYLQCSAYGIMEFPGLFAGCWVGHRKVSDGCLPQSLKQEAVAFVGAPTRGCRDLGVADHRQEIRGTKLRGSHDGGDTDFGVRVPQGRTQDLIGTWIRRFQIMYQPSQDLLAQFR